MRINFLLLFLIPLVVFGQKEFNNWHFGYRASITFNGGGPALNGTSSISHDESTATVSDCEGNLLFYTDGSTVWNKNNAVMSNGTGLAGGGSFLNSTQGSLIVKRPKTTGIYYIFTSSENDGINYSTVNMNANSGLGSVIIKNTNIGGRGSQKLAVTYHSNGSDIWVVTHYSDNNQYEAFLVTPTGVNPSGINSFDGPAHTDGHGDIKISQDGKKIGSVIDFDGKVYLGDFNNSTGRVTGTVMRSGFQNPHGVEFSPDNSKMYINSTSSGIIQFDLSSGSNSVSLQNSINISTPRNIYGSLQLGPDGRIYVTNEQSSSLSVIVSPNQLGFAANFAYESFFIGSDRASYSITNVTLTSPPSFNGPNTVNYANSCLGNITQFSLGNSNDIVDVLWEFGDVGSGLQNFSTLISPTHEYKSVGTYFGSVEINYECGSETINFTVVISQPPSPNLTDSLIVCSGVSTSIGVPSESNVNYSWTPSSGLNSSQISNPSLTLQSLLEKSYSVYTLTAENAINGCTIQDSVVIELTNPIVDAGSDTTLCSLDTIQIGSVPRNNYTYQWSPNNDLLSPNSGQTKLLIDNVNSLVEQRNYLLTAMLEGCVSTDDVNLSIKPLPILIPRNDTTICSLDSIVLNSGGNGLASYVWSLAEGLSSVTAVSPNFSIANKDTTIKSFKKYAQISFDGCVNVDSITINVRPQAGVDGYQYLCPGFGVELNPYGKGVNYLWSPNQNITDINIKNPIVNPLNSTIYYVAITDVYNCTYSDSVLVDVDPLVPVDLGPDTMICRNDTILLGSLGHPLNAVYDWGPKVFISNPDSNYTFVYPDSTKSYIIISQSDTCKGRDTIEVKVNQLPIVQLDSDSSICLRDSILLLATGAKVYSWGPNTNIISKNDSAVVFPTTDISYIVSGTDSNGCVNFDTANITVRPLPDIKLVEDTQVCFTHEVQVVAQGGVLYSWFPASLVSNSSVPNPFLKPTVNTQFIVTVTGLNKCIENDTVDVLVNSLPDIKLTSDTIICEGTNAFLWATGGVKYSWSPAANLSNVNLKNPVSNTVNNETYQVIVTDQNNCIDSANTNVTVNVNPVADFEYLFMASCPGFDVDFTDKSTNAETWNWNFGDGMGSSEVNPQHVFSFGINAKTQLVVGNNNVCFDTAFVEFNWEKLEDYVDITAPNVITPNGDKINDCFSYTIEGDFESCTRIEFFNRWGMKVYDSDEFSNCFRGVNEYNFQELSAGTYFYVITINDYLRNGFVEIIKK